MHIVVCIKEVPDSAQIRIHPVTNTIMRQGVPAIINPYDLFALEEALGLKDRWGAKITVISMGPPQAAGALKKALSYGADQAVLLTDKAFAGADTLATSYALGAAIRKLGETDPVDLVLTGKQTIDGDTAQVGPGLSIRLGAQLLTYVSRIRDFAPAQGTLTVERRAEGGVQVLTAPLPCVVTMLEGSNELRFAKMPDMFRAARYDVPLMSRADAGIEDVTKVGLKGSPTVVNQVFAPPPKAVEPEQFPGETPDSRAEAFVERLFSQHPGLGDAMLERLDAHPAP